MPYSGGITPADALTKGPSQEKKGNYEGFLTAMVPWESPEQAVTDCAHKENEHTQDSSWFQMPVSCQ